MGRRPSTADRKQKAAQERHSEMQRVQREQEQQKIQQRQQRGQEQLSPQGQPPWGQQQPQQYQQQQPPPQQQYQQQYQQPPQQDPYAGAPPPDQPLMAPRGAPPQRGAPPPGAQKSVQWAPDPAAAVQYGQPSGYGQPQQQPAYLQAPPGHVQVKYPRSPKSPEIIFHSFDSWTHGISWVLQEAGYFGPGAAAAETGFGGQGKDRSITGGARGKFGPVVVDNLGLQSELQVRGIVHVVNC